MSLTHIAFDIDSLHAAYRRGATPRDLFDEVARRIDALGDPGIFIHRIDPAGIAAQIDALPPFDVAACPLWGIPFAVKDNIDAAGEPTTAACPAYRYVADRDAFVVARLREAGAILVGKTNLDQFATGLVGVRSPYPAPKNALDPTLVPGGSSSGSAVAVAREIVAFALGTDTAGSGRVPAALNNIVGLKPTLGTLSGRGVVPACRSLDTVSIFALTADDAYRVLTNCARFDAEDPYARRQRLPASLPEPAPGLRVAVPAARNRRFFGDDVQARSFADTLRRLREFGLVVDELEFDAFDEVAAMLYEGAWVAERVTVVEDLLRSRPEALHPVTRGILAGARNLSAAEAFRGFHRLRQLQRRIEPLLLSVDLLCVPSIPTFYRLADLEADPLTPNSRLGTYTNFVNLLDLCGIAVPVAPRGDGRPGGVTLLGARGEDARVAALAARLHHDAGIAMGAGRHPVPAPLPAAGAAADGEVPLLVVGAHLSGLPLNGELTRRGGRFLCGARTAARYRLFHLAGDGPARPGLVRSAGPGHRIEAELWSLPTSTLGDFVADIPPPLAIGTVELDDGRWVKGFVCEAAGTADADDISRFGGWRHYLSAGAVAGAS